MAPRLVGCWVHLASCPAPCRPWSASRPDRADACSLRAFAAATQELTERLGKLRVLEPEIDGRFEIPELASTIVAPALERVGQHGLFRKQTRDAIGELDLA